MRDASELAADRDLNERLSALWDALSKQRTGIEDSFRTCYQDFLIAVSDIRKKQADLEKRCDAAEEQTERSHSLFRGHQHGADGTVFVDVFTAEDN